MRKSVILPVLGTMLVALTSTIAASGVDGSYTCSSASACFSASQSAPAGSSGAGFHGSATNGPGLRGNSTNSVGTLGQSAAGSVMYPGVEGESTDNNGADVAGGFGLTGVSGTAPAYGVYALGSTYGVSGITSAGYGGAGIFGQDSYTGQNDANAGVSGITTNGTAVKAVAGASTSYYIAAHGIALEALNFNSGGIGAIVSNPSDTLYVDDSASNLFNDTAGAFSVDYKGNETLGGQLSSKAFSVSSLDANEDTSYVRTTDSGYLFDGGFQIGGTTTAEAGFNFADDGSETLTGTLHAKSVMTSSGTYARTRGASGIDKIAYGTRSTAPAIDDVGGGQLVEGSAYVRLDPDLADVIDRRLEYRVFLTPRGDSKGLFVTAESPSGFMVRESQGGRSNIAFDYRIVAKPLDEDGRRLAAAPIERPFALSKRSENGFLKSAAVAVRDGSVRKISLRSHALDPFEQLKERLGPAKFAAALAEFKRQHR